MVRSGLYGWGVLLRRSLRLSWQPVEAGRQNENREPAYVPELQCYDVPRKALPLAKRGVLKFSAIIPASVVTVICKFSPSKRRYSID
jgi:hypothetical protein